MSHFLDIGKIRSLHETGVIELRKNSAVKHIGQFFPTTYKSSVSREEVAHETREKHERKT